MVVVRMAALVAMVVCAPLTQALDPDRRPTQYLVDRFGRAEGLPSDTTWEAREGPRGFLWIGTRGGLARFDGDAFRVYNSRSHEAFRSNDVRALTWTADGDLWIGTYGGGALRMRGDTFEVFDRDRGLAGNEVYDVLVARDGSVWFSTVTGVSRLREGEITSWTRADGLAADRVLKIAESDDGTLWVSTLTDGLSYFDGGAFHPVGIDAGLDSLQIHLLTRDDRLGVVAGTAAGSLYQLASDGSVTPVERPAATIAEELLRDRDGNLWLGSYGHGLWRISADGREERFSLGHEVEHVFDLYEDIKGNLWVASVDGLLRLRDSDFLSLGASEALADATFVVAEDAQGNIWTGTEGRGLFRIGRDGAIEQPVATLRDLSISALLPDATGALWVGTFGQGLYRLRDGELTHFDAQRGLSAEHVFAIAEAQDGYLWIATNRGIDRLDPATAAIDAVPELDGVMARHLLPGRDGGMWLSTNDGLLHHDGAALRHWGTDDGLPANLIAGTHEDERGVLWIVTRSAHLARMERGQVYSYRDPALLPVLSAFAIVEDSARTLWVSGSEGLVALPRNELDAIARGEQVTVTPAHYAERDGLRSSHFMGGFQPAAWAASDNRLWFPTNRGLTAFDPRDLVQAAPRLVTYIDQVRAGGVVLDADPLELPAGVDHLEIDYTTPALASAHAVTFRYRLLPSGAWVDAGTRRTAYFSALPPGSSRFQVQARIGHGPYDLSGDAGAGIRLYRHPHWHETRWAAVALALAVLAGMFACHRLLDRRARRREAHLKHLVDRRTEELREALVRVQTHSRIDSLTGLANRRHLDERLRAIWNLAKRSGRPVSIIMIDIDYFKAFNDSLGHGPGDECLRQISAALSVGLARDHDVVARYGGEEFLIALYDSDMAGAERVARRIVERVRALRLPHPASPVAPYVTISAGYSAALTETLEGAHMLIDVADRALYRAKKAGRNRVAGLTCDSTLDERAS